MKHDVQLIPQGTSMGCWAAGIAMILGWKNQASFDPGMIAANPGGLSYEPSLKSGLDPNDKYILEQNGFELDRRFVICFHVFRNYRSNGPLWVAGAVPTAHIRVVNRLRADALYQRPVPVNQGAQYCRSFTSFLATWNSLVEEKGTVPVYVAI